MANIIPKINIHDFLFLTKDEIVIQKITDFIEEWNNSNDFIISKTSGSTGVPKEILIKKRFMIESARLTGEYFNFQMDQNSVLSLSTDTIAGKMQVIRALIHNMKLIVTDNSRNPLKDFDLKADFISLVPLQLEEIISQNSKKLNQIKNILIGGSAIKLDLEEKIKLLSSNFFESYGMTETISHVALRKISLNEQSHFKALKGISFSEKDNCLIINAPKLGIKDLKTNDVVDLISSTEFILKGRNDFVINSGGYKFHPELLEKKLEGKIDFPFFIIGEKNQEFGEIITLFIEMNHSLTLEKKIKSIFLEKLKKYEIPKKVYFVSKFEKTESGKINRLKTQQLKLEKTT